MDTKMDIVFREDSSLLEILQEGVQDEAELRMIISTLVLRDEPDLLVDNPKLYAIYRLAEMIMAYEDVCSKTPAGII